MNDRTNARRPWLFIAFFLLAGALHSTDPEEYPLLVSALYCAEYAIYAGLILFWMLSVSERLLPTRAKGYLLSSGGLMLLFLAAQFTKYRIAVLPGLTRLCWYVYYVPLLFIPTLFLMTSLRIGREAGNRRPRELLLLIPAGLLALGVLTNDLHMKAFLPNEMPIDDLIGKNGTYTHGFLFYTAYGWAGAALTAGVFSLTVACKRSGNRKKALLPLFILLLIPPLIVFWKRFPKDSIPITYEWAEMCIFSMISVFESCIRSRLIPSNGNYPGFFSRMDIPALITDRNLKPAFRTRSPVRAEDGQLRASLNAPLYPVPDIRLYGMNVRSGFAFWTEDESALNRLNEELRDVHETLLQENDLLERERELTKEQARVEERSRLYQKAALEVYPTQKKISEILKHAQPGTASFRPDIAKALALTAYVKRKANFVLMEAERGTISAGELASALEESSHYLHYCGMSAAVDNRAGRAFPCREAMAAYDCFEAAVEALLGKKEDLFIHLQDHELLIMADEGANPENMPDLPLPLRLSREDGQLVLRFMLEGDSV